MTEAVLRKPLWVGIPLLQQETGVHGCPPGGTDEGDECRVCDAVPVCDPPNRQEVLQEA
jgi:hypothetical protein